MVVSGHDKQIDIAQFRRLKKKGKKLKGERITRRHRKQKCGWR